MRTPEAQKAVARREVEEWHSETVNLDLSLPDLGPISYMVSLGRVTTVCQSVGSHSNAFPVNQTSAAEHVCVAARVPVQPVPRSARMRRATVLVAL